MTCSSLYDGLSGSLTLRSLALSLSLSLSLMDADIISYPGSPSPPSLAARWSLPTRSPLGFKSIEVSHPSPPVFVQSTERATALNHGPFTVLVLLPSHTHTSPSILSFSLDARLARGMAFYPGCALRFLVLSPVREVSAITMCASWFGVAPRVMWNCRMSREQVKGRRGFLYLCVCVCERLSI